MKKIISLFQRNYDGDKLVRNEVVPGAEWVLSGKGLATRKWDGTCCLVKDGKLYKRYDAKHGKTPPAGFIPAQEPDPITGHWPGWLLIGQGNEDRYHREAFESLGILTAWTYELCGPKINGNPEQFDTHVLIPHGFLVLRVPRDFDGLRSYFAQSNEIEGIVWWRDINDPDCDKVKLKLKDFGLTRVKESK